MRPRTASAERTGPAHDGTVVTVTPNAAVDVTYRVASLAPGSTHRVIEAREVAGGKGVNVASVLAARGHPVVTTGLLGGLTGDVVRADLDARRIEHHFLDVAAETRRTLTVVDASAGDATVFNEPGPSICHDAWSELVDCVRYVLRRSAASVLVASGSLPPGAPSDAFTQLTRAGHDAGCRVVVDTSGPGLLACLAAHPDVVKPNLQELIEATGLRDPVAAVRSLHQRGARVVLLSLGPDGLVLAHSDHPWVRARLDQVLTGNPTGAGDAAVAAIAACLADRRSLRTGLVDAVAWSAAAVLQEVAGTVDAEDVDRLLPRVQVAELTRWDDPCW